MSETPVFPKCEFRVTRSTQGGLKYKAACDRPASLCRCSGLTSVDMNLCGLHRSHVVRFYGWVVQILSDEGQPV
jgi:hypothetical protein